jgi:ABC-type multidrug transport system fused ATPase/permease subunit
MQMSFPDIGKAGSAVERVFPIADRQPLIDSASQEGRVPDLAVQGHVELCSVVFAYPSRPSVLVFNGFSLSIVAGEEWGWLDSLVALIQHRIKISGMKCTGVALG